MKIYQRLIPTFYLVFTLISCDQTNEEKSGSMSASDTTTNAIISSSAAVENSKDTARKFIRTAELKFKVKSVITSTYDIEDITSRHGGFVSLTNLTSSIDNFTTIAVSADSSLETTYFTTANTMTLRVPNTKLDTTLKEISKNIQHLDFRIIKADDVALVFLSNGFLQNRSAISEGRLTNAIDKRGTKLNEIAAAEGLLQAKQEGNDNAKISNLSLADQIHFSTINLSMYERQALKKELVLKEKNVSGYEPGAGHKILESLKYGWDILAVFLIFLARLWGLLLFSVAGYFFYKSYTRKLK